MNLALIGLTDVQLRNWDLQLIPINTFLCCIVLCRLKAGGCRHGASRSIISEFSTTENLSCLFDQLQNCKWKSFCRMKSITAQQINAGPNNPWLCYLMQSVKNTVQWTIYAYNVKTTLSLRAILVCAFLKAVLSSFVRVRVGPFFTFDKYKQRDWWWSA